MSTIKFGLDYAKRAAGCKKCKQKLEKGELRMWRLIPNPFTAESEHPTEMKNYFHPSCLFETLSRCRVTTKVIESANDVDGWDIINDEDKTQVLEKIEAFIESRLKKSGTGCASAKETNEIIKKRPKKSGILPCASFNAKPSKEIIDKNGEKVEEKPKKYTDESAVAKKSTLHEAGDNSDHTEPKLNNSKFDTFKMFCKLCDVISAVSKHTDKSTAVRMFITKDGYDGDIYLLLKLLIPSADHHVYNLKAKQMIKIFANIFDWSSRELSDSYNQSGDVSLSICEFMQKSDIVQKKSNLTNKEVDEWLEKLSTLTREEEQQKQISRICKLATPLELKYIIRIINKDLRIGAGAKYILEGVEKGAYAVFQSSQDLKAVIEKCQKLNNENEDAILESGITVGVPVKPMLAEPCRSVEQAMKKCQNGMYAEIKYDGERLQLHKKDTELAFFSRSLKPSQNHKVEHVAKFIAEAFPTNENLVLDAEMLLVDTKTGKPLPFGTLGIHKKKEFTDAVVCFFIFDCIQYGKTSLINKPLRERRQFLEDTMKEIPNRVLLSNKNFVKKGDCEMLKKLIQEAIDEGLEGLVLKDVESIYEPGKRHWLKVKRDYLDDGTMADSVDLIVLGAYYGTGSKGGMMSVFLMGVYDNSSNKYLTVTKCGNGHDDDTLDRINKELNKKMKKINGTFNSLPSWIECSKSLVPDFIIDDPKSSPVWEIVGAEFSKSNVHSAGGISIRFPRVTKIRDDKNWETATNFSELKKLYETAKMKTDMNSPPPSNIDSLVPLYSKEKLNVPCGYEEPFEDKSKHVVETAKRKAPNSVDCAEFEKSSIKKETKTKKAKKAG